MTSIGANQIETGTIYEIPAEGRHGRSRDLFTVWFGANLSILTIVTGALGPTVFKLGFVSSLLSLAIGTHVGAVFMALHAAQGPQLGVPQMVQTRGQFGSLGAVAVVAIVVVMYVGFFASNLVLGAQSLHSLFAGLNLQACILTLCLASLLAAVFGHDLIHACAKGLTLFCGLALGACALWILFVHGLPQGFLHEGPFAPAGFVGNLSTSALWQIAYAPYVSDYSRYMPKGSGSRDAFWASYAGTVLGTAAPMTLGVTLAVLSVGGDVVSALTGVMGPLALLVVPVFAVGVACSNAMNLYCGALSAITIVQTFRPTWRIRARARVVTAALLAAASAAVATLAAPNFMTAYTNFLSLLL